MVVRRQSATAQVVPDLSRGSELHLAGHRVVELDTNGMVRLCRWILREDSVRVTISSAILGCSLESIWGSLGGNFLDAELTPVRA
jgi:hypothetical protein